MSIEEFLILVQIKTKHKYLATLRLFEGDCLLFLIEG